MIKKLLLFFAVSFLLVLSVAGTVQHRFGVIASLYVLMSTITLLVYKWDKQRAMHKTKQKGRISERKLHYLAILCGWPGAVIAQQWFRHKSQKRPFIAVLWLTIIINITVLSSVFYWQLL